MSYQYDGHGGNCSVSANAIGHLTTVSAVNAAGTSFQSAYNCYDAFGRVTQNTQTVAGQPYLFSYLYNLAGGQTQMTYPSGRAVTTGYDGAGRPVSVTGALSGASTPYIPAVTSGPPNVQYAAQGAISQVNLHNGLSETTGYNARLQPTSIQLGSLLTLAYGYSATNNNGNVGSQTITSALAAGGTMTAQQVYGYDGANRLTSVAETVQSGLPNGVMAGNWSIAHGYDQYGNQWATTGLPIGPAMPTAQTQFNAPLNRLSARSTGAALPADAYDAAGNLQDHPDIGQMTYDAENRQLTYSNGGGQAASYDYDGEGRRVRKTTPAGTTVYVYDAAGELATEMDPPGSVTDTGTLYLTADHLGSTRAVTDASGGLKERWDYFPFGQTIPGGQVFGNRNLVAGYDTATGVTLEFTGKERDSETGLDYFEARYYSSAQGRFTSPDWSPTPQPVPYANLSDPQTLNLYTYGRNNPLSGTDPDGHCTVDGENHGFWWCVGHAIGAEQTQKEQAAVVEQQRTWLIQNTATNDQQRSYLQQADASGVKQLYGQWNNAIQNAEMKAGFEELYGADMYHRASNGDLVLYRGGGLVATPKDVKIDPATGMLNNTHGISLNIDPAKVSRFGDPQQILQVPPDLRIIQRGKDPGHFEITPRNPGTMTFDRFNQLLQQITTKLLGPG